jgi:hypothetical protein
LICLLSETVAFLQANLAASYNRSLWRTKGAVISEEIRALNNVHGHRGCGPPAMIGAENGIFLFLCS